MEKMFLTCKKREIFGKALKNWRKKTGKSMQKKLQNSRKESAKKLGESVKKL